MANCVGYPVCTRGPKECHKCALEKIEQQAKVIDRMTKNLTMEQQELGKARNENVALLDDRTRLQESLLNTQKEIDSLKTIRERLRTERDALGKQLHDMTTLKDRFNADCTILQKELDEVKAKLVETEVRARGAELAVKVLQQNEQQANDRWGTIIDKVTNLVMEMTNKLKELAQPMMVIPSTPYEPASFGIEYHKEYARQLNELMKIGTSIAKAPPTPAECTRAVADLDQEGFKALSRECKDWAKKADVKTNEALHSRIKCLTTERDEAVQRGNIRAEVLQKQMDQLIIKRDELEKERSLLRKTNQELDEQLEELRNRHNDEVVQKLNLKLKVDDLEEQLAKKQAEPNVLYGYECECGSQIVAADMQTHTRMVREHGEKCDKGVYGELRKAQKKLEGWENQPWEIICDCGQKFQHMDPTANNKQYGEHCKTCPESIEYKLERAKERIEELTNQLNAAQIEIGNCLRWKDAAEHKYRETMAGLNLANDTSSKLLLQVNELKEEVVRLKEGRFTEEEFQNLCHTPGCDTESCGRFQRGCFEYWIKLFGYLPARDTLHGRILTILEQQLGWTDCLGSGWRDKIAHRIATALLEGPFKKVEEGKDPCKVEDKGCA